MPAIHISKQMTYTQNVKRTLTNQLEKGTNQTEKWAKDLKRHIIKGNTQMVNKNMKIYSTSLVTREMHTKTTNEISLCFHQNS